MRAKLYQNIRLKEAFWTGKKSKIIVLLLFMVFLGELPFIIGSDIFHLDRQIYGITSLTFALSKLLRLNDITYNISGWLLDFDKIIPWVVTIVYFFLFRSLLKKSEKEKIFKSQVSFQPFVFFSGVVGAILISIHYITSKSGHYTSFLDKGLFNAANHIFKNDKTLAWLSLFFYRIVYLTLAPVQYFVLFATLNASISYSFKLIKLLSNKKITNKTRSIITNKIFYLIIICGVPSASLFVLHNIVAKLFGWQNYIVQGLRFYIVWIFHIEYILFISIVFWKLKKEIIEKGKRVFSWTAIEKADTRISVILKISTPFFLLLLPFWVIKINVENKNLNTAIFYSCIAYTIDYHNQPVGKEKYNTMINHIMRSNNYVKENEVDSFKSTLYECFLNPENETIKALIISTIALHQLGIKIDEFKTIRDSSSLYASSLILKYLNQNPNCYPLYSYEKKSKQYFENNIQKLTEAWQTSYKEADFKPILSRDKYLDLFLESILK